MGRIDSLLLNTAASATAHSFPLFFPLSTLSFFSSPHILFSPSPLTPSVHILTGSRAVQAGRRPNKIPELISRYRDGPKPTPSSLYPVHPVHPTTLHPLHPHIYEDISLHHQFLIFLYVLVLLPADICFPSRRFQRGTRQYRLMLQGRRQNHRKIFAVSRRKPRQLLGEILGGNGINLAGGRALRPPRGHLSKGPPHCTSITV